MDQCSRSAAGEQLAGTAPQRKVWFIIEQPGAWGENALLDSALPPGFGQDLLETVTDPAIGIAVARRPDIAAAERRTTRRRRLWLAHTAPGGIRMRAGSLDDIRDVLKWDWQAILRGELPAIGRRSADPVLFICTNGKRDACCAIEARGIVDALRPDPELTGQVYEISHLGGHRFAPTGLLLPWGINVGRLSIESTQAVLADAWNGRINPEVMRGRTALPAWAQSAEIAVRRANDVTTIDVLDVVILRQGRTLPAISIKDLQDSDIIQVRHSDGRAWNVGLSIEQTAPRKESCTKEPSVGQSFVATSVDSATAWHL